MQINTKTNLKHWLSHRYLFVNGINGIMYDMLYVRIWLNDAVSIYRICRKYKLFMLKYVYFLYAGYFYAINLNLYICNMQFLQLLYFNPFFVISYDKISRFCVLVSKNICRYGIYCILYLDKDGMSK